MAEAKISWFDKGNDMWIQVEVANGWVFFRTLSEAPEKYMLNPHFRIEGVPYALGEHFGVEVRLSDIKRAYRNYEKMYEAHHSNEGKAKIIDYYGSDEGVKPFKYDLRISQRLPKSPKIPKLR